jgi:prepilin-type N-terminal cleavage/methylation domain-containing protein
MQDMGSRRVPRRSRWFTADSRGFTLIELMIVILIMAILVAIAIALAIFAKSNAQDSVAKRNYQLSMKIADKWWFDHMVWTGATATQNYYYNTANYAAYLSRRAGTAQPTVQGNQQFIYTTRTAANTLSVVNGRYKSGALVAGTNNNTLSNTYGYICVYAGYRTVNTDAGAWTNSGAPYTYMTFLVVNPSNNQCYYASYNRGRICCSGVFDWNPSTMVTSNFRAAPL